VATDFNRSRDSCCRLLLCASNPLGGRPVWVARGLFARCFCAGRAELSWLRLSTKQCKFPHVPLAVWLILAERPPDSRDPTASRSGLPDAVGGQARGYLPIRPLRQWCDPTPACGFVACSAACLRSATGEQDETRSGSTERRATLLCSVRRMKISPLALYLIMLGIAVLFSLLVLEVVLIWLS